MKETSARVWSIWRRSERYAVSDILKGAVMPLAGAQDLSRKLGARIGIGGEGERGRGRRGGVRERNRKRVSLIDLSLKNEETRRGMVRKKHDAQNHPQAEQIVAAKAARATAAVASTTA
ncbi:hypothetical protein Scep_020241 [Stephania cephalantha]|uniref:Uncharacterized protein n=1 Tax=Stephania cephalantha TaxID=152367 RepID=A0AAP0ICK8_9MAGN